MWIWFQHAHNGIYSSLVNTPDDYDTALSHEAYHDHRVLLGIAEG
jgi:hypothetical protein